MPTSEEILKEAREQEEEAKRKAAHPVTDLRELNTNLDPDAEAEGKAKVEPEEEKADDAPKKRTGRKES